MKLFRLPKRNPRYTNEETPLQRFFRCIIIALLFCAVIWGFWINNQRRMEMLKKPEQVHIDKTGLLTDEQQKSLARYQERFREVYGLNLVIRVRNETFPSPFLLPEERAGTVFLGLSPRNRQALFELPPLAEAALGPDLVSDLRLTHFVPYFDDGSWPEGLASCLNLMTARLDAALPAQGEQAGAQRPAAPPRE